MIKKSDWTSTFPPKLVNQNFAGYLIFAESHNTINTFVEHHFQPNLIKQLYKKSLKNPFLVISSG